jgi:hypothetical protein
VELWVSTNTQSTIHSVNELDILSNGPIYVDAKTLSPNNIRFQKPDGAPGRLIYSPRATGGSIESDRFVPPPVDPPPVDPPMPPVVETPNPEPPPNIETAPLPPLPELNRVPENAAPTALQAAHFKTNSCPTKAPGLRRAIACSPQQKSLLRQVQSGDRPEILPPEPSR